VEAAKETGVPACVLAGVAAIESRFVHDHPKGKDRVIGLMNIQEDVARGMGIDPHDPRENVLAGAKILQRLIRQRGSLVEALKKYNPKWTPAYIREVVKAVAQAEETTRG
jgi:membrane-bound lytic murein transglycosylase MltF